MSDLNQRLSQASQQLKPFLRAYLLSRGIKITRNNKFPCPVHDDKRPSANFIPGTDDTKWKCQVCQDVGGDILNMHSYLVGAPQSGKGWVIENLLPLCKEFGIEVPDDRELTPDEVKIERVYKAYQHAAKLLQHFQLSAKTQERLDRYRWPMRVAAQFGVGGVSSFVEYMEEMEKAGFEASFLKAIDLANSMIFNQNNLIFALKDEHGRTVAFSARNLDYDDLKDAAEKVGEEKGQESEEYKALLKALPQKYFNSAITGWNGEERNPIFHKSKLLYGLHQAKGKSKMVYVFEGQTNTITAVAAGLLNCVSLCGVAFTKDHLSLLLNHGFTHIVCVMDPDEGGSIGAAGFVRTINEYGLPKQRPDIRVELMELPEGPDPDELIRTQGLAEFLKAPRRSMFCWQLVQDLKHNKDGIQTALDAIALALDQPNALLRYDMLSQVERETAIPLQFLWSHLVSLAEHREDPISKQVTEHARWMTLAAKYREEAREVIAAPEPPKEPEIALPVFLPGIPCSGMAPLSYVKKPVVPAETHAATWS